MLEPQIAPPWIEDAFDPRVADFHLVPEPEMVRRRGLFVAESREVVRRLLTSRYRARALLLTETVYAELLPLLPAVNGPAVFLAKRELLQDITGYKVHRGCLGLGERGPGISFADLLRPRPALLLALENVTDPDNVGTVFRSARAFGAGGVLLCGHCADPLYRKAIRTSLGNTLHLPFATVEPWQIGLRQVAANGYRVVAITPRADAMPLEALAPASADAPLCLVFGNEGLGLDAATEALAHARVQIRMVNPIDSVNIAAAAAIALHRVSAGLSPEVQGH
jgi:tRNA G18 (ribose-2'-O)-methylase SpoU